MKLSFLGAAMAALAMLSGVASTAKPSAPKILPLLPGIYSDVRMSGETGDLGGIEIRVLAGKDAGWAEAVHCEGWCNSLERVQILREMDGYRIDFPERSVEYDEAGNRGKEMVTIFPIHIRTTAKGLRVITGDGESRVTRLLKKQKQEFGLDVARDNAAENAKLPQ